ncbi:MAG: hypothetical protein ACJ76X_09960 [Solirubrobacteraceae bacterium]|jgi:hypothetical protein
MRSSGLLLVAAGAVALLGCGTTSKSGHVGDGLSAGGVQVTIERIDRRPPVPSDDVSGLSTPAPGDRLIGARVKVCSKVGAAIGTYDFSLTLADGGQAQVKFPAQNYPDGFDVVRTGCGRGWIVFEYPRPTRPSEIHFKFDDTGDSAGAGNPGGSRQETHERFSWKL